MTTLWIDLESRSRCDLETAGVYNYAADPSTEIVICSYAVNMGPVKRWTIFDGEDIPAELERLLEDELVEIRAHNAAFERLMLKHCWKIDIEPIAFHCTAFQARSCSLPGSLADMGRALTADLKKDPRGWQLIRLLSIPREDGSFNEDPKLYAEFGDYCDRDVVAMRAASLMLPSLSTDARRMWAANELVNDAGMPIDSELCRLAIHYAQAERDAAQKRVVTLTDGALGRARGKNLTEWVHERLPEKAARLMRVVKRRAITNYKGTAAGDPKLGANRLLHLTGEEYATKTLDKETRAAIFAMAEETPEDFDDDVMAVMGANDAVTSTSVYKFQRMLETASSDGRLRGAFIPGGASGTGRFSSHAAQLHNFPRKCAEAPEAVKAVMARRESLNGPVLEILKSMLRPTIGARDGYLIVRADWNAIEARALPWLTGRASAVLYLDAFRDPTRDIYIEQARLCGLGENRQAGKVVVLAFGYGGGVGALAIMSKAYAVRIEGSPQAIVDAWRRANRWAVEWWSELDRAARAALTSPSPAWFPAGRVAFRHEDWGKDPEGNDQRTLTMLLPSGRMIYYPYARLDEEGISYLKAAWKPRAGAEEWPRARLWGGLLAENATQATCADLLREALVRAVEAGIPVIGHVHDEIVAEAPAAEAPAIGLLLKEIMLTLPDWAAGLPLAVEVDISPRYRK